MSNYTITRQGDFFTLTETIVLVVSRGNLNMYTDGVSDIFYFGGFPLDYTLCTSPSGATSAADLMSKIRDLS
jgi:hypothetical protein